MNADKHGKTQKKVIASREKGMEPDYIKPFRPGGHGIFWDGTEGGASISVFLRGGAEEATGLAGYGASIR